MNFNVLYDHKSINIQSRVQDFEPFSMFVGEELGSLSSVWLGMSFFLLLLTAICFPVGFKSGGGSEVLSRLF